MKSFQTEETQQSRAEGSRSWKLGALALAVALSNQAMAQQSTDQRASALEEIVVTAQRRSEYAQDVPITIATIGEDLLSQGDVQQLGDISKLTPGLRFDNQGPLSQPTVRGVGTAVSVSGGGSNVGIYIDGFYSPNPLFADTDLLNVESVQVLKGPQGTLFGRNSTGGAILVTTGEPESDPRAEMGASYGSYDTQRYDVYATGGPSEDLAFDIAAQWRSSDGFVDNIYTGEDDVAGYENWSVRLGSRLDVSDRTSITLRYIHTDTDDRTAVVANVFEKDGRAYTAAPLSAITTEPDEVTSDFQGEFFSESDVIQLTVESELDNASFTSYTQYRRERASNEMDFDVSALPLYHYIYEPNNDIYTQEFLLSSVPGGRLQWTSGLFLYQNESWWENNRFSAGGAPFVINGGSGTTTRTVAAFGDVTYELTPNLFLTGGLRVSYDETTDAYLTLAAPDSNGNLVQPDVDDIDDTRVTPRVVIRYTPTDASSIYGSYTQGYKAGLLNVGNNTLEDGVEVDPEEVEAFEIGYKYASGAMTFDAAAFYYDYQDLQVATFEGSKSLIDNAADSRIYGLEGQAQLAITDSLDVNVGAAWIDAEYENFDRAQYWVQLPNAFVPNYGEAGGLQMQRTPEFTANLGIAYNAVVAEGILDLSGNLYYTSDFYFDTFEQFEQEAYELLSLRAAWTDPSDRYTVAVYGDNLTDSEYRSQVLPQFFGIQSMWAMPRTFGASLNVRF